MTVIASGTRLQLQPGLRRHTAGIRRCKLFASKGSETLRRKRPCGFGQPDAPPRAYNRMGNRQFMRRGTGIHMGIMQHEILDMDEFTGNP
ncbi:hypothetical protein D9M70_487860 [compost metagenome]